MIESQPCGKKLGQNTRQGEGQPEPFVAVVGAEADNGDRMMIKWMVKRIRIFRKGDGFADEVLSNCQIALLPRRTALLDISVMPRCRPVNSGEAQPLRCSILPDTHAQAASPMAVKDRGKLVSFKKRNKLQG